MNENKKYDWMVYVQCMTFDHASFIKDAMDGFAMQETTFPVVSVIVDDASTDGEQEVIRQYLLDNFKQPYRSEETEYAQIVCAKHRINPNCVFVVLFLKYNHYKIKKSKLPYLQEWHDNAKYFALCEGDDYWTDSHKLQMQVDFLESHSDYSATVHQCKLIGAREGLFYENVPETVKMSDIISNARLFHTASVVYRAGEYLELPPMKMPHVSGDKLTFLKLSFLGMIKYFDNCMGVYRIHSEGVHSTVSLENLKNDRNIMIYMKSIDPKFPKYRFLSFLYGTFALYPQDVSLIKKIYYLFISFVLSFSYYPNNIRDLSKKIQRYRKFKNN